MYIVFYDNGSGELGFGVDDESQTERFTWKDSQITDEKGETLEFGGLFGSGPVMSINKFSPAKFISRGGHIPAPLQSLKN